jgi:hypothetical protein
MAATQSYFSTMRNFYARLTTGVAADDGSSVTNVTWAATTATADSTTPLTTDWMLSSITINDSSATGVGDIADSMLRIFYVSAGTGNAARLIGVVDLNNPNASSTTSKGLTIQVPFGPQWTFNQNSTIAFNVSVTPTSGNLDIVGFAMVA